MLRLSFILGPTLLRLTASRANAVRAYGSYRFFPLTRFMKFIHTSDWHLGRSLCNHSLLDDQAYVLDQIVHYAQHHQADALVIAGDVYDRAIPPAAAVTLLNDFLNRMHVLKIPVIIIPGNHDSADRLGFAATQLDLTGVHIIADFERMQQPVTISSTTGTLHFYGIPFADPEPVRLFSQQDIGSYEDAHRYLISRIRQNMPEEGAHVLISHCFLAGSQESESERPLTVGGSDQVSASLFDGFSYVALGHIHGPQAFREGRIRYSGSPLKYSFSEEKHSKGVLLVEIDGAGKATSTALPLKPMHDVRSIQGKLNDLIEAAASDPHSEDYLLARLTDEHAILDPMSKLREVYPNLLQMEKPRFYQDDNQPIMSASRLRRDEFSLFSDFFEQVSGQSMTATQQAAMRQVIEHVLKSEA